MVREGECLQSRSRCRVASHRRGGACHIQSWHCVRNDLSGYPSQRDLFESAVRSGSFTAEKVILGRRSGVSMVHEVFGFRLVIGRASTTSPSVATHLASLRLAAVTPSLDCPKLTGAVS